MVAHPAPRLPLGLAVLVALAARRPWALWVTAPLLASALAAAAVSGLAPPPASVFQGPVTLVSDPSPTVAGQRVEVRVAGRHLDAWARGSAAGALVDRLSGEQVWVRGRVVPLARPDPWLSARHIAGRFEIESVERWSPGHPASRLANGLRRTLVAGARDLPDDTRALFAGFVLGDDRGRSAVVTDDFRGAGLTHLLAVSGQNVAFVLAVLDPILRRLTLHGRLGATIAALAFFALLTRFEPSVLRATVMAGVATVAVTWGREASSVRLLALAVAALVLVDPLLVRAVGFRLSVAASAGIVVLAPRVAAALPGPSWFRLPLAVSLAAQVGVGPVLLAVFGGLPVVGVPANLLAVPAAGPISTWGLTAGLVAGVVPSSAGLLHLPTRVLVGWVAGVAHEAVRVPLGQFGPVSFAVVVALVTTALAARQRGRHLLAVLAVVGATGAVLTPAVRLRVDRPPAHEAPTADADLWRSGGRSLLAIGGRVREDDLLQSLRVRGVTELDVVVCRSAAGGLHRVVAGLRRRFGPFTVVAPGAAGVEGATSLPSDTSLTLGDLVVRLRPAPEVVEIEVAPASGPGGGPV